MKLTRSSFVKSISSIVFGCLVACGGVGTDSSGNDAGSLGGAKGTGGSGTNCNCMRGAYRAACGVDGKTYDATCGDSCVPVAIACYNTCPCSGSGSGGGGSTGGGSAVSTGGSVSHGTPFACGSSTCSVGDSYCYQFYPGVGAASSGPDCRQLPPACANATDCSCVCSNVAPSGQCSPSSGCSCTSPSGEIRVTCAGA